MGRGRGHGQSPPPPPPLLLPFSQRSASHIGNFTRVLVDKFLHACDLHCTYYTVYRAKIILCKDEVTLMVLADFSKAFDTVNYKVLINAWFLEAVSALVEWLLKWPVAFRTDRWSYIWISERMFRCASRQLEILVTTLLSSHIFQLVENSSCAMWM